MKKQLPLFLGMVVGFFALAEFYIPWYVVGTIQERLLGFAQVLAAAAFVLGGINVIQVNWPKIRRRENDWQYKIVLLGSAALMGLVGVQWHTFGGESPSGTMTIEQVATGDDQAVIRVTTTRDDAIIKIDGQVVEGRGEGAEVRVAPGKHSVRVYMDVAGYSEYAQEPELAAGQAAVIEADLITLWGPTGRVYVWMYDYVFYPCNATMFALLAFFIASAAFRAFRARNAEAALLLGAAIIIMLGRAPIGRAISDLLPLISDWILDVPNNAGRRAIMMGAALGAIATGLRIILGLERSHLGAE
jgi:hypothetical protein